MTGKQSAYLILRLGTGINFFFHGAMRFFYGIEIFKTWLLTTFENSPLPSFLIAPFGYLIPTFELVFGAFLILGFKTKFTLEVIGVLVLFLLTGMSILQKWDVVAIHMTYLIALFILLFALEYNSKSLDRN